MDYRKARFTVMDNQQDHLSQNSITEELLQIIEDFTDYIDTFLFEILTFLAVFHSFMVLLFDILRLCGFDGWLLTIIPSTSFLLSVVFFIFGAKKRSNKRKKNKKSSDSKELPTLESLDGVIVMVDNIDKISVKDDQNTTKYSFSMSSEETIDSSSNEPNVSVFRCVVGFIVNMVRALFQRKAEQPAVNTVSKIAMSSFKEELNTHGKVLNDELCKDVIQENFLISEYEGVPVRLNEDDNFASPEKLDIPYVEQLKKVKINKRTEKENGKMPHKNRDKTMLFENLSSASFLEHSSRQAMEEKADNLVVNKYGGMPFHKEKDDHLLAQSESESVCSELRSVQEISSKNISTLDDVIHIADHECNSDSFKQESEIDNYITNAINETVDCLGANSSQTDSLDLKMGVHMQFGQRHLEKKKITKDAFPKAKRFYSKTRSGLTKRTRKKRKTLSVIFARLARLILRILQRNKPKHPANLRGTDNGKEILENQQPEQNLVSVNDQEKKGSPVKKISRALVHLYLQKRKLRQKQNQHWLQLENSLRKSPKYTLDTDREKHSLAYASMDENVRNSLVNEKQVTTKQEMKDLVTSIQENMDDNSTVEKKQNTALSLTLPSLLNVSDRSHQYEFPILSSNSCRTHENIQFCSLLENGGDEIIDENITDESQGMVPLAREGKSSTSNDIKISVSVRNLDSGVILHSHPDQGFSETFKCNFSAEQENLDANRNPSKMSLWPEAEKPSTNKDESILAVSPDSSESCAVHPCVPEGVFPHLDGNSKNRKPTKENAVPVNKACYFSGNGDHLNNHVHAVQCENIEEFSHRDRNNFQKNWNISNCDDDHIDLNMNHTDLDKDRTNLGKNDTVTMPDHLFSTEDRLVDAGSPVRFMHHSAISCDSLIFLDETFEF